MNQRELLIFSVDLLERIGIPYMIVGSLASSAYGEPRLTQDIDIVIVPSLDQVRGLCAAFPTDDFYVSVEAALRAAQYTGSQFNVLHPESGNKIDFMIARNDHGERSRFRVASGFACSPAMKLLRPVPKTSSSRKCSTTKRAARRNTCAISGILKVNDAMVDRTYMVLWAEKLGLADIWKAILKRVGL